MFRIQPKQPQTSNKLKVRPFALATLWPICETVMSLFQEPRTNNTITPEQQELIEILDNESHHGLTDFLTKHFENRFENFGLLSHILNQAKLPYIEMPDDPDRGLTGFFMHEEEHWGVSFSPGITMFALSKAATVACCHMREDLDLLLKFSNHEKGRDLFSFASTSSTLDQFVEEALYFIQTEDADRLTYWDKISLLDLYEIHDEEDQLSEKLQNKSLLRVEVQRDESEKGFTIATELDIDRIGGDFNEWLEGIMEELLSINPDKNLLKVIIAPKDFDTIESSSEPEHLAPGSGISTENYHRHCRAFGKHAMTFSDEGTVLASLLEPVHRFKGILLELCLEDSSLIENLFPSKTVFDNFRETYERVQDLELSTAEHYSRVVFLPTTILEPLEGDAAPEANGPYYYQIRFHESKVSEIVAIDSETHEEIGKLSRNAAYHILWKLGLATTEGRERFHKQIKSGSMHVLVNRIAGSVSNLGSKVEPKETVLNLAETDPDEKEDFDLELHVPKLENGLAHVTRELNGPAKYATPNPRLKNSEGWEVKLPRNGTSRIDDQYRAILLTNALRMVSVMNFVALAYVTNKGIRKHPIRHDMMRDILLPAASEKRFSQEARTLDDEILEYYVELELPTATFITKFSGKRYNSYLKNIPHIGYAHLMPVFKNGQCQKGYMELFHADGTPARKTDSMTNRLMGGFSPGTKKYKDIPNLPYEKTFQVLGLVMTPEQMEAFKQQQKENGYEYENFPEIKPSEPPKLHSYVIQSEDGVSYHQSEQASQLDQVSEFYHENVYALVDIVKSSPKSASQLFPKQARLKDLLTQIDEIETQISTALHYNAFERASREPFAEMQIHKVESDEELLNLGSREATLVIYKAPCGNAAIVVGKYKEDGNIYRIHKRCVDRILRLMQIHYQDLARPPEQQTDYKISFV